MNSGNSRNIALHLYRYSTYITNQNTLNFSLALHVNKVESPEGLWEGRDDRAVALGVVVQLEQGSRHQLVVTRHSKVSLLLQLNKEQLLVLLRLRDVGGLGWLEVGTPPVPDGVLNLPAVVVADDTVCPSQRLRHDPLEGVDLILARSDLPPRKLEEGGA